MKRIILTLILLSSFLILNSFNYGKNKIQKEHLKWSKIETIHFDIYFNQGDDEFGKIVALIAEEAYFYLKEDFKTPIMNRIPIIFYKSHQDFETTNVIFPLLNESVGGFTETSKNRVAVPFDGSYKSMEETFVHELTHAYINELNRSRNRFLNLAGLPFWFSEGLPEFESVGGESVYNNIFIIDMLMNDGFPDLNEIGGFYAYRMGESFLAYLSEKYGRDSVIDLFYALRMSSNLDASVNKIFTLNFRELQLRWHNYLKRKYYRLIVDFDVPYEVYERKTDHIRDGSYLNYAPRFSPDGLNYLYFSNKNIKSDIWFATTHDVIKRRKIVSGESSGKFQEFHFQKNNISWFPDGVKFAFISKTATGDKLYVMDYLTGKILEKIDFREFDAIFEIDISHDGSHLVFSGQKDLKNDIYIYDLETDELEVITNDNYNDSQPRWSPDGSKIAYVSERDLLSEKENKHIFDSITNDIFYYDLEEKLLYQVTNDSVNNTSPIWTSDGNQLLFINEREFTLNFDIINLISGERAFVTSSLGSVFMGDLSKDDQRLIFSCFYNNGWDIFIKDNPLTDLSYYFYGSPCVVTSKENFYNRFEIFNYKYYGRKEKDKSEVELEKEKSLPYQAEIEYPDSLHQKKFGFEDEKPVQINEPEIKPYRIKFTLDRLWGGMAYSPSGGTYAQLLLGLSDLMGNHGIGLNIGISGELDNSNFIFTYLYLAHKIDYGFGGFYLNDEIVYRIIGYANPNEDYYMREREREYGIYTILRYPFNKFLRVDLENVVFKTETRRDWWDSVNGKWIEEYLPDDIDEKSKDKEFTYTPQISLVHDNTIYSGVGPISGWRGALLFNRNFSTEDNYSIIYGDFRNYFFFSKRYSFATRLLAGTIFGDSNQRFGMDYINGVRGFEDENLVGTRKVLVSAEIRYPFVDNLRLAFPFPIYMYNIRGSAFVDTGIVWEKDQDPVLYKDDRLQDLKMGFGFGPRINLGYFVLKFDIAWNTDLNKTSKPSYYISLSPDF